MRIGNRITGLVAAVLLGTAAMATAADQKPKKAAPAAADDKAAMEAMMKAATPGEQHKKLEALAGTFDAKVTTWMKPGEPPAESTGTSESKMALGGRYLEEHFEGTFMGQPFSGVGYTGYDNVQKKYVGTWMDSMSTGVMVSTGTMSPDDKTFTMSGSMADPLTRKMMTLKEKLTVSDADHHVFEMWGPGPDGKSYKMMEITYTRRK